MLSDFRDAMISGDNVSLDKVSNIINALADEAGLTMLSQAVEQVQATRDYTGSEVEYRLTSYLPGEMLRQLQDKESRLFKTAMGGELFQQPAIVAMLCSRKSFLDFLINNPIALIEFAKRNESTWMKAILTSTTISPTELTQFLADIKKIETGIQGDVIESFQKGLLQALRESIANHQLDENSVTSKNIEAMLEIHGVVAIARKVLEMPVTTKRETEKKAALVSYLLSNYEVSQFSELPLHEQIALVRCLPNTDLVAYLDKPENNLVKSVFNEETFLTEELAIRLLSEPELVLALNKEERSGERKIIPVIYKADFRSFNALVARFCEAQDITAISKLYVALGKHAYRDESDEEDNLRQYKFALVIQGLKLGKFTDVQGTIIQSAMPLLAQFLQEYGVNNFLKNIFEDKLTATQQAEVAAFLLSYQNGRLLEGVKDTQLVELARYLTPEVMIDKFLKSTGPNIVKRLFQDDSSGLLTEERANQLLLNPSCVKLLAEHVRHLRGWGLLGGQSDVSREFRIVRVIEKANPKVFAEAAKNLASQFTPEEMEDMLLSLVIDRWFEREVVEDDANQQKLTTFFRKVFEAALTETKTIALGENVFSTEGKFERIIMTKLLTKYGVNGLIEQLSSNTRFPANIKGKLALILLRDMRKQADYSEKFNEDVIEQLIDFLDETELAELLKSNPDDSVAAGITNRLMSDPMCFQSESPLQPKHLQKLSGGQQRQIAKMVIVGLTTQEERGFQALAGNQPRSPNSKISKGLLNYFLETLYSNTESHNELVQFINNLKADETHLMPIALEFINGKMSSFQPRIPDTIRMAILQNPSFLSGLIALREGTEEAAAAALEAAELPAELGDAEQGEINIEASAKGSPTVHQLMNRLKKANINQMLRNENILEHLDANQVYQLLKLMGDDEKLGFLEWYNQSLGATERRAVSGYHSFTGSVQPLSEPLQDKIAVAVAKMISEPQLHRAPSEIRRLLISPAIRAAVVKTPKVIALLKQDELKRLLEVLDSVHSEDFVRYFQGLSTSGAEEQHREKLWQAIKEVAKNTSVFDSHIPDGLRQMLLTSPDYLADESVTSQQLRQFFFGLDNKVKFISGFDAANEGLGKTQAMLGEIYSSGNIKDEEALALIENEALFQTLTVEQQQHILSQLSFGKFKALIQNRFFSVSSPSVVNKAILDEVIRRLDTRHTSENIPGNSRDSLRKLVLCRDDLTLNLGEADVGKIFAAVSGGEKTVALKAMAEANEPLPNGQHLLSNIVVSAKKVRQAALQVFFEKNGLGLIQSVVGNQERLDIIRGSFLRDIVFDSPDLIGKLEQLSQDNIRAALVNSMSLTQKCSAFKAATGSRHPRVQAALVKAAVAEAARSSNSAELHFMFGTSIDSLDIPGIREASDLQAENKAFRTAALKHATAEGGERFKTMLSTYLQGAIKNGEKYDPEQQRTHHYIRPTLSQLHQNLADVPEASAMLAEHFLMPSNEISRSPYRVLANNELVNFARHWTPEAANGQVFASVKHLSARIEAIENDESDERAMLTQVRTHMRLAWFTKVDPIAIELSEERELMLPENAIPEMYDCATKAEREALVSTLTQLKDNKDNDVLNSTEKQQVRNAQRNLDHGTNWFTGKGRLASFGMSLAMKVPFAGKKAKEWAANKSPEIASDTELEEMRHLTSGQNNEGSDTAIRVTERLARTPAGHATSRGVSEDSTASGKPKPAFQKRRTDYTRSYGARALNSDDRREDAARVGRSGPS